MPLATGTKLDGYELLGLLGAGGMGEVYRARDSALRREIAIKVLPTYVSGDPDRLRRFEREAQAAAALNHPNILAVHRFGVFEEAPYLVTELLEGSTLREVLRHGALSPRKVIDYGVQIAHGLAAAHDKGIVHRDLKPENLFVTRDGRVKILDFGLARLISTKPDVDGNAPTLTAGTDPGVVMGTAGYMSPEQVRGTTVDHRTDIFAFGAILYEMLSGKRAFQRSTSAETMTAILHDEPPGISQIAQTVPPGLQRFVHHCLEKNPEQRFHSASDLAFALEALSESGSGPAVAIESQASRSRWIGAAVAIAALVVIAALILWWRMPGAVPVVESITQLTDDGRPKGHMTTDGLRIYFQDPEVLRIGQVSASGGATAPVETGFAQSWLAGIMQDGSALLVAVPADSGQTSGSNWLVPVPAGEPRRLGNFDTRRAALFPDGRIVFAKSNFEKGTGVGMDWFVAEKDGSNPRKLVSLPGRFGDASVSPDGKRIILTQAELDKHNLYETAVYEIAADGTGLHEIRRLGEYEWNFRWTPDGKYLVYQNGLESQSDIWLLPMKKGPFGRVGEPIQLTHGPLPYSYPCPSRDGKQIFVLGSRERGELVRYDVKSKQFVPFLSGISATDPTFSSDGKWVAYASFPDHTLWRSRSDGSERMQLTYAPTYVVFPQISPDGTEVTFFTPRGEIFLASMEGGTPRKISGNACCATWSPDSNLLLYLSGGKGIIADLRTGEKSAVPSLKNVFPFWLDQDTLIAPNEKGTSFVTFNRKTGKWTDMAPIPPGGIGNWMMSPDYKYMYFSTAGAEPKVMRLRIAERQVETITSLKDFHRLVNSGNTQINVAPDGSPLFTRDKGYREIYALNVRWP